MNTWNTPPRDVKRKPAVKTIERQPHTKELESSIVQTQQSETNKPSALNSSANPSPGSGPADPPPPVPSTRPLPRPTAHQEQNEHSTTPAAPIHHPKPTAIPPPIFTEHIKSSLLFLQARRRSNAEPLPLSPSNIEPTDATASPTPARTAVECVDQSLQRPVTWSNEHFAAFIQKTPPADAVCEICCEKVIGLKEWDIECLSDIFRGLGSTDTGRVTHAQLKQVLEQWNDQRSHDKQPTFDVLHLLALAIPEKDEMIDHNLFVEAMKKIHCCQTLCVCRPPRWLHHHCLHRKLAIGINNTGDFLLRCGYCRTSVWGVSYSEWHDNATSLLNNAKKTVGGEHRQERQNVLDEAYELAMDALNAVVRCGGGGVKQNAILGDCLSMVGAVVYEQQKNSNGGVPRGTLAGQICRTALRMGAPPSISSAWIFTNLCWSQNATRKRYWLDLALKCCEESKRCIQEPKKATALSIQAEHLSIAIQVQYPGITREDVLNIFQQWPWGVEEMPVYVLHSMCFILAKNDGACLMKKYLERGERLVAEDPYAKNPVLFEKLRVEYEKSLVVEPESTCVEE